ncbi:MAG: Nif3-like dinuclear metal center hexameric protein [Elusimicrobiaceae bacterium]|nr:Nif3-like dinuclear metal center hexameric protein [Elusimicrobiaceae bacterium]
MVQRDTLIKDLNKYLEVAANPEHNGLQVQGKPQINKIAFGVSATMALFKEAKDFGADMVIVHHGLFWNNIQTITGVFGQRIAYLIKNDINLAGYHLPLDKHKTIGNNACLAKLLKLKDLKPFGTYHGQEIGLIGKTTKPSDIKEIHKLLKGEALFFGPKKVKTIAIVSGGAHDMLEEAVLAKADLYITGSRDEYITEYCREAKINFIAMGHYNSEKLGIQALMNYVSKKFKVQTKFIDINNPF